MSVTLNISGSLNERAGQRLDDISTRKRLDSGHMLAAIESFPDQLRAAPELAGQVDWLSYKPTTPAGVCVCGMGGSAIGGDLVRSYWEPESPVPMVVVRSDRLPEYINRFWMVIASTYSGDTQETLSAVDAARCRGCNILAVTSGGRLGELAKSAKWPVIRVPGGLMPRAALGYSFGPIMLALIRWGIVPDRLEALTRATDALAVSRTQYGPSVRVATNSAKQAATALFGRTICVYGATGFTDVIGVRFKCQFAENSKAIAFANAMPELTHNEIVGLDASADPARLAVVILRLGDESPVAQRRFDWLTGRLGARGIPVLSILASGPDRLSRMLSLVQFGDYLSYYLAIAADQDPTPIPAITALKAELG